MSMRSLRLILAALMLGLLCGCATTGYARHDPQALAGRTYVVTGASSGFGRGVALELASRGANVVLAARRTGLLEEVATQVRTAGGTPLVVTTDVSRLEDMQRLRDEAVARFGRIDVWINNAGIGGIGRFWDIPAADQARLVSINLDGVIFGSHVAIEQFRRQGRGTLVNVSSMTAVVPMAYQATYSATKAGVLALGRALNEELRLAGLGDVRVATVLPWAADTPFDRHAANYSGRTPQLILPDGPQKVVDAIVRVSLRPQEELAVGWKAKGAVASHWLLPDLTERLAAQAEHTVQMERAPPAPPTPGSLYTPVQEGRGVDGDVRERMRRERAERNAPPGHR